MYDIRDRRGAIRELQHYLRTVSHTREGMAHTPTDGFYGDATAEAVRFLQKEQGMPVTGKVGYRDFQEIYLLYLLALQEQMPPSLLPPSHLPMQVGNAGSGVIILQTLLAAVLDEDLHIDGRYGRETERAVQRYRRRRLLPPESGVDLLLWEALCEDFRTQEERAREE